jgi:hypothetical protein
MKLLHLLQDFKIEMTGGYALYGLLCILLVTLLGTLHLIRLAVGLFGGMIK